MFAAAVTPWVAADDFESVHWGEPGAPAATAPRDATTHHVLLEMGSIMHQSLMNMLAGLGLSVLLIGGGVAQGQTATATAAFDQRPAQLDIVSHVTAAVAALTADDLADEPTLPAGTQVDTVAWEGNFLHIWLTLPADAGDWVIAPAGLEAMTATIGGPLQSDDTLAGVQVHLRPGSTAAYQPLAAFAYRAPAVHAPPPAVDIPTAPVDSGTTTTLRGPTVQAAQQPAGALSGVVIYAAAGHGWTAGTSDWFLQRPVLLDMNEDHGNIDQLNYFVNYAFNAGATVVPTRPVGWQPVEVVLDQDDPEVTYTGAWSDSTYAIHYENGRTNSGVSYRFSSAVSTETATARYTPTLPYDDFYPVYCFTPASTNRVRQTYRIAHSGGISEVVVDHREVGNGWVWLGDYYCKADGSSYVEITNQAAESGVIVADAIRWGCGMGDYEPYGTGSASGYQRAEEGQRYWAAVELGENASGFDSTIWDLPGYDDRSDNIGAGARVAREMNQVPAGGILVDRYKRIYLEFHTNASSGTARGQICLITTTGATTYQTQFAQTLSNEVDADLLIVDDTFEHAWVDRTSTTYTDGYGAISTGNNDDEFDATIVELAFHDNQEDAELLRDPRVRAAMARACVHGITRFLHSLSGSTVPLAFAPDTPRNFAVVDLGGGDVQLQWTAPLSDGARGDPATGYVIYQSTDGYGFGSPIVLGNVTSSTLTGLPAGEVRYFRVAARNAGGESMPTEVLAVRRASDGSVGDVLIVNGFDRLRRTNDPVQTFLFPAAYAGLSIQRQIWRQSNSFDYVIQHGGALAALDEGFSSCANDAVAAGVVQLADYAVVDWILGTESYEDATFDATEQTLVANYLNAGGKLFASGSNLAFDLIGQSGGSTFAQEALQVGYVGDDAGTYDVVPADNGIFNGLASFSFAPAAGAPYDVPAPDQLDTRPDSAVCLYYVGATAGIAGVQYTSATYNVVVFGFPFEAIGDAGMRTDIMARVLNFLRTASGPLPFDDDNDNDIDDWDFRIFQFCMKGPDYAYNEGNRCRAMDGDGNASVDLADFALMQQLFTGALAP